MAFHLLKLCHFLQDRDGFDVELRYLRDRTGREVDFLLTVKGKPWVAVEAKVSGTSSDPALIYVRDRLKIPFVYQVVLDGGRDFVEEGVRCVPAAGNGLVEMIRRLHTGLGISADVLIRPYAVRGCAAA